MRIAVFGAEEFLTWHLCCRFEAEGWLDSSKADANDHLPSNNFDTDLAKLDWVLLVAPSGASDESNAVLAIDQALELIGLSGDTPGIGIVTHRECDEARREQEGVWVRRALSLCNAMSSPFMRFEVPVLFGEGQDPADGVVSAMCASFSAGDNVDSNQSDSFSLVHAQDVAEHVVRCIQGKTSKGGLTEVRSSLMEIASLLREIRERYASGALPDLSSTFTRNLFNTYRSHRNPEQLLIPAQLHSDERGALMEVAKVSGGQSQIFLSRTLPGFQRGNHYHLRKLERFFVVDGAATISMRKVFSTVRADFEVSGDLPVLLDIPTLWTHNITNTGSDVLITQFFADEEYDPNSSDTFPQKV